jgi:hypothetical protein
MGQSVTRIIANLLPWMISRSRGKNKMKIWSHILVMIEKLYNLDLEFVFRV